MSAEFVRERITQLRIQKNVSEYKMSYDLGHNRVRQSLRYEQNDNL